MSTGRVGKIVRGLSGGKGGAASVGSDVPATECVAGDKERGALADLVGFAVFGDYVIGHGARCYGARACRRVGVEMDCVGDRTHLRIQRIRTVGSRSICAAAVDPVALRIGQASIVYRDVWGELSTGIHYLLAIGVG